MCRDLQGCVEKSKKNEANKKILLFSKGKIKEIYTMIFFICKRLHLQQKYAMY